MKLDAESLNARLTRLEDRINSGDISVRHSPEPAMQANVVPAEEEVDTSQEEISAEPEIVDELPAGMWTEICTQVRKELKPPVSGFFAPNGPIQGILQGNAFVLSCANGFTKAVVDKPEVLELVARKVSAKLGKPVRVVASDKSNVRNEQLEQLLQFGREHSNVINIKD